MPKTLPEAPPQTDPTITYPPCPGCPDPDNAKRLDMPCPGPERIKDPSRGEFQEQAIPALSEAEVMMLGSPAVADLIYCPRTRGSKVS